METNSNTQAALDAGKLLTAAQRIGYDGKNAPVVIGPDGTATTVPFDLVEKWLEFPVRKRGTFKFGDSASFIAYFNEHKNGASRIFAAITDAGATFKGILNFHDEEPDWSDHVCEHALAPTREWALWTGTDRRRMSQAEFATFLEDNSDLFTEPAGADLLELIQNLEGHANVSINQAVKLNNGAIKLTCTEEVTLKGQSVNQETTIEVPQILNVSIVPFVGQEPAALQARLRYRIADRKITFWYETINPHKVVRELCVEILDRIGEKTKCTPFITA